LTAIRGLIAVMTLGLDEAKAFLVQDKEMVGNFGWRPKSNHDRYPVLFFEARLSIGQTVPRGLKFRSSVFPTFPNTATFQLECDMPKGRTCITLYRMEWNPISGHMNGFADHVPADIRGLTFMPGETHEHICTDNIVSHEGRLRASGVQAARAVTQNFVSYDDAFAYVCAKIHIINPEAAPPSNAQWDLV
jgi:hypothetical protein